VIPANIRIRVALALHNVSFAQELEWLFPIPRQEELVRANCLPWTWDEILYGTPTYEPIFCLCCYSKLGYCIGGKITFSCHCCAGRTEHTAWGAGKARTMHNYLEYSTGYCPELISLLLGEASTHVRSQIDGKQTNDS